MVYISKLPCWHDRIYANVNVLVSREVVCTSSRFDIVDRWAVISW